MLKFEAQAAALGYDAIAGVDEAGRGPLAGPVVAAAVIFARDVRIDGVDDSKKLSAAKRNALFPIIQQTALSYGVGVVDEKIIDEINILQAARLAMKRAVEQLNPAPDYLLIDGNREIDSAIDQKTVVKGDSLSHSIAAASVLAKVARDRLMEEIDRAWPQYGFKKHKGYPTQAHRDSIRQWGPCPAHRVTFKGVKEFLATRQAPGGNGFDL